MSPSRGNPAAAKKAAGYISGNANIPHRIFPTGSRTSGESGLLQRFEWRAIELRQRHVARVPDVLHPDRRRIEPARREIPELREEFRRVGEFGFRLRGADVVGDLRAL